MRPYRWVSSLLVLLALGPVEGQAQTGNKSVPVEVRRRLAQAIWPESLFDSQGRPESGFIRRGFRPAFADLRIRRVAPLPDLPGVTVWIGSAYPTGCSHCATVVRAVVQRDSQFITLLEPTDIPLLVEWVQPAFQHADTVRVREFIVAFLRSSCFLGCELAPIAPTEGVPSSELRMFHAPDYPDQPVAIPRTYSHVSSAGLSLEFVVRTIDAIYRITAARDWRGSLSLSVTPVAYHMLRQ
jgi:hypothetical protein